MISSLVKAAAVFMVKMGDLIKKNVRNCNLKKECFSLNNAVFFLLGIASIGFMVVTFPRFTIDKTARFLPYALLVVIVFEMVIAKKGVQHTATLIPFRMRWPIENPNLVFFCLFFFSLFINLSMLFYYWSSNSSEYFSIGGLVPYSDAMGYFYGAKSLIEQGSVDAWTARRPLAACFYAILLKITNQNLQITLLITCVLFAVSLYFFAKGIADSFGISAGVVLILLLSYYNYPLVASPMTENVGLIFANFAGALFWTSIRYHSRNRFYIGLFLFSLAQNIRVGALLVIPLMVVFAGYVFRGSKRFSYKVALVCCLWGGVPFLANTVITYSVAPKEGWLMNGNISYTLYGLVKGDRGWHQVFQDHPELFNQGLSDGEISKRIFGFAIEEFRRNPIAAISALGKIYYSATATFFSVCMPFRFFTENTMFFAPFLVAFISPFVFLQNRREVWAVLLFILVSLGVLASWPIVKDGGQRAIAVTTPFTCAIIACGVGMIVQIVNGQGDFFTNSLVPKVTKNRNEIYMVSFLTLVLFVGPLVLKVTKSRNIGSMIPLACPQKTLVFRVCKGSSIAIVDDDSSRDIRSVTIYDYLASGPARDGDTLFSTLRPGDYLYSGVYNFANPKQPCKYLVLKEDVARFAGKIVTCCVEKKGNNLWFGENVSLLSKKE